ncbi:PRC-barrel domain-containing protein [Streptomyces sp. NPDC005908]|uniref:PRC-barrel domain-containing protein n=1 Tax=unclassified Streptomyces TaxID=2593676 RepID=UPI0011ADDD4A|nr:PRC-barrel domain-containing protein [Streptomyces sp. T12]TWD25285.1 PRC-barrel domain protein [Streptomyces sp. T12]
MTALFSEVCGLPVAGADGARLGAVRSLTVDAASGRVTHARIGRGRWRRDTVVAWDDLRARGPGLLAVRPAAGPARVPARRELLGSEVLTECGEEHGTVLDAAFDPSTGRLDAVLTSRGEVSAERLLGLGDHALVVRDARGRHPV